MQALKLRTSTIQGESLSLKIVSQTLLHELADHEQFNPTQGRGVRAVISKVDFDLRGADALKTIRETSSVACRWLTPNLGKVNIRGASLKAISWVG